MSLLKAESVTLLRAARKLVDKVSIAINSGELVGLIGPNGAGKSTLLSMLAGLDHCDEGSVILDGQDIQSMNARRRSQTLAWVAQSGPVNWPLSVERVITLGRRPHLSTWQKLNSTDADAIEYAIRATDCQAIRTQDATTLSGGERTRMLLARALAAEPEILLADEPIAALDLKHQLQTMEMLREFASHGRACLVVLHDLSLAGRFCDRLYLMHEGKIAAHGNSAEVLTAQNLQTVYGVSVAMGEGEVPWVVPVKQL